MWTDVRQGQSWEEEGEGKGVEGLRMRGRGEAGEQMSGQREEVVFGSDQKGRRENTAGRGKFTLSAPEGTIHTYLNASSAISFPFLGSRTVTEWPAACRQCSTHGKINI